MTNTINFRGTEYPVHEPRIKFSDLKEALVPRMPPRAVFPLSNTLDMLESLSGDQCRYALWCILTVLFGSNLSNTPEVLRVETPRPDFPEMSEAQLILCQIGMPTSTRENQALAETVAKLLQRN